MFVDRQVDGTTIIQESSGLEAAYSDVFMQYHNRAFVLASSRQDIHHVADLAGRVVFAFQNASKYLGDDFAHVVAVNPRYKEVAQQEGQAHMLLLGRIDVAVMEESIFKYYRLKLIDEGRVDAAREVTGIELFPPTRYKAAFVDPAVRDAFNRGVAAMRTDGRYEAIYRKYTEQYFDIRR